MNNNMSKDEVKIKTKIALILLEQELRRDEDTTELITNKLYNLMKEVNTNE